MNIKRSGCSAVVWAALISANTWASDGSLAFVGAVVVPTCGVSTSELATDAAWRLPQLIGVGCGRVAGQGGSPRSFSQGRVSTTRIAKDTDDRVLSYFYGYRVNSQLGSPNEIRLVLIEYN